MGGIPSFFLYPQLQSRWAGKSLREMARFRGACNKGRECHFWAECQMCYRKLQATKVRKFLDESGMPSPRVRGIWTLHGIYFLYENYWREGGWKNIRNDYGIARPVLCGPRRAEKVPEQLPWPQNERQGRNIKFGDTPSWERIQGIDSC